MKKIMEVTIALMVLVVFIAGGLISCAPSQPEEKVTVGVFSMMDLDVGVSTLRGAEIAADEINANGGILGMDVEVVSADTKGLPDEGLQAFEYLIESEDADLLIGPFAEGVLSAVFPRLAEYKVPLITSGASSYMLGLEVAADYSAYKGWFRVMPMNELFLAYNTVEFAASMMVGELGWNSTVIFREDAAWTDDMAAFLEEELPKVGLNVYDDIVFPVEETNFVPYYNQAEASGADCIFPVVAEAGIAPILQYADLKPNMPMVGIVVAAQVPEFYDDTGGLTGNVATMNAIGWNAVFEPIDADFIDSWTAKYTTRPAKPDYAGFGAYYALLIFRDAAERAGTLDFDTLVEELEQTSFSATMTIEFYAPGELDPYFELPFTHDVKYGPGLAYPMWTQWQGDDAYAIWPPEAAVRDYEYADWIE